jgi:WD40 repeat protein
VKKLIPLVLALILPACEGNPALKPAEDGTAVQKVPSVVITRCPGFKPRVQTKEEQDLGSISVTPAAFSPDGRYIAAAFSTGVEFALSHTLGVWEVASGRLLKTLESEKSATCSPTQGVTFSRDGKKIIFLKGKSINIWDFQRDGVHSQKIGFSPLFSLPRPTGKTMVFDRAISLLPRNRSRIKLFDADLASPGKDLPNEFGGQVMRAACSPDGKFLLGPFWPEDALPGFSPSQLVLWRISDGKAIRFMKSKHLGPSVFSPDGKKLVTSDGMGRLVLWELETGNDVRGFEGDGRFPVAFSPDGKFLLGLSRYPHLTRFDPGTGKPDPLGIAKGMSDSHFSRWDVGTGKALWRVPAEPPVQFTQGKGREYEAHPDLRGLAFSSDCKLAFTSCGAAPVKSPVPLTLKIWDAVGGKLLRRLQVPDVVRKAPF